MDGQMSIFDYIQNDNCIHHDITCRMRPCAEAQGVKCCQECDFNKNCQSKCSIKPKSQQKKIKMPPPTDFKQFPGAKGMHDILDKIPHYIVKAPMKPHGRIGEFEAVMNGSLFLSIGNSGWLYDEKEIISWKEVGDEPEIQMSFKELQENCIHQGSIFNGGIKACGFKNKQSAKCWDDWQPCTLANCPFGNGKGQKTEFYKDEDRHWQVRNIGEQI